MQNYLIGLHGKAGAGKDTVADRLIARHGYRRVALADAVKQEVADAFLVTVAFLNDRNTKETPTYALSLDQCADGDFANAVVDEAKGWNVPLSPRWVCQRWGTEYRRKKFGDDYWINLVDKKITESGHNKWVVPDVRFDNEVKWIRRRGGVLVEVVRPGVAPVSPHDTEKGISEELKDHFWIHNDSTFENVHRAVDTLAYVLAIQKRFDGYLVGRDEG